MASLARSPTALTSGKIEHVVVPAEFSSVPKPSQCHCICLSLRSKFGSDRLHKWSFPSISRKHMWWLKSQWFVELCGSGMNVYSQCEISGRMCSCVQIFWAESSIFHSKYSFSTVHQMAKLVRYEHFSKTKLLLNNAIIITIHHFHMSMTLTTVYQNYAYPFYSNIELQKIPHTLLMSWHRVAYYFAPIRTKHNAMQKNMTAVGAVAIMARAQIKSKWKRNINNSKCFFAVSIQCHIKKYTIL